MFNFNGQDDPLDMQLRTQAAQQFDSPYYDKLFASDRFNYQNLNDLIRKSDPFLSNRPTLGGSDYAGKRTASYKTFAGLSNATDFGNALTARFTKAKDDKAYRQRIDTLKGLGMDELQAIQSVNDPKFSEYFTKKGLAPRHYNFVAQMSTLDGNGDTIPEAQQRVQMDEKHQLDVQHERDFDDAKYAAKTAADLDYQKRALLQEQQFGGGRQQPQQQFSFQPQQQQPQKTRGSNARPVDDSGDIIEAANAARFAYNQPGIGAVQQPINVPKNVAATGVVNNLIRYDERAKQYVPVQINGPRGDSQYAAQANQELVDGKAQGYTEDHAKQFRFNIQNAKNQDEIQDKTGAMLAQNIAPIVEGIPRTKSQIADIKKELSGIAAEGNVGIAKGEISKFSKTDNDKLNGVANGVFVTKETDAKKVDAVNQLSARYNDAYQRLQAAQGELDKHNDGWKKAQKLADLNGYMISPDDGRVYDPRRNKPFGFQKPSAETLAASAAQAGFDDADRGLGRTEQEMAFDKLTPYADQSEYNAVVNRFSPPRPAPVDAVAEANHNYVLQKNAANDAVTNNRMAQDQSDRFGIDFDSLRNLNVRSQIERQYPNLPPSAVQQMVTKRENERMNGVRQIMKQKNVTADVASLIYDRQGPPRNFIASGM